MNNEPFHILLADDDESDRLLFKEALEELKIKPIVHTENNGIELMAYLTKTNARLPRTLLLPMSPPAAACTIWKPAVEPGGLRDVHYIFLTFLSSPMRPGGEGNSLLYNPVSPVVTIATGYPQVCNKFICFCKKTVS